MRDRPLTASEDVSRQGRNVAVMQNALIRAFRTYAQTFVGLLVASNVFGVDGAVDLSGIQVAAVSAIPAALAVVVNWLESLEASPDYPRG